MSRDTSAPLPFGTQQTLASQGPQRLSSVDQEGVSAEQRKDHISWGRKKTWGTSVLASVVPLALNTVHHLHSPFCWFVPVHHLGLKLDVMSSRKPLLIFPTSLPLYCWSFPRGFPRSHSEKCWSWTRLCLVHACLHTHHILLTPALTTHLL